MNTSALRAALGALLIASSAMAMRAAEPTPIEGRLDNGLTYFICPNRSTPGRADFFLSRKIGSLAERENERGLAHFLEHIAFNGTRHFPGNSIISWLESNGVKFGADLNAHTAIDETAYNISRVPVSRQSALDSCLLILRDWSCDLTLDDKEIDAERGVIRSEWRHRNTAANRLLQRAAPRIYGRSLYGRRLPMGLMEVVDSFPPQLLRDFYRHNYTPDNEAIIVVGDVDADYVERKIKSLMGNMPRATQAVEHDRTVEMGTPLNVVALADPELGVESVQLMMRHPRRRGAEAEMLSALTTELMLPRLDALELEPESCAGNIGIGDGRFMLSDGVQALTLRANVDRGNASQTIYSLMKEVMRAHRLGFTEEEVRRAKQAIRGELEAELTKGRKRTNTDIARAISSAWLAGEQPSTPEEDYRAKCAALDSLTAADVAEYLKRIVHPDGTDVAILSYSRVPANEGAEAEKRIAEGFERAVNEKSEPFVAAAVADRISIIEPAPGCIVASGGQGPFGTEVITLSNGLKMYLCQNKEKPGKVILRGSGPGGLSQEYAAGDAASLKLINEVMAASGAGEMDNAALRRFLNGKDLKVSALVSNTAETIEFSSSTAELENAFRLLYLKATAPAADRKAFEALMQQRKASAVGRRRSPIHAMGDSITFNVYSRHPLAVQPDSAALAGVDYDRILQVYRNRFSEMSDFAFYMIGDFDRDSVIPLIERYIASLPCAGRIEKPRDIGYRFAPSTCIDFTKEMSTPVAVVYQMRHARAPYSLESVISASAIGQLLKSRLLADLREKRGITYGITTHGSIAAAINGDDAPEFMMPVYVKVDPQHTYEASAAIDSTLADMAAGNITKAELDKVKAYMLKNVRDGRHDNAYRLLALQRYVESGLDLDTDYEATVEALTPATLAARLAEILARCQTIRITLHPVSI